MTTSPAGPADQLTAPARTFTQRFSSTPRGARLARHLTAHQLDAWGVPYGTVDSDTAALLVAELAANAVTHGRVPGRDFELALFLGGGLLRIAVSDARGERRLPWPGRAPRPGPSPTPVAACSSWTRWPPGGRCATGCRSARPSSPSWTCRTDGGRGPPLG